MEAKEKTAEVLNKYFSYPRSADFEKNAIAAMEEYASIKTKELQEEMIESIEEAMHREQQVAPELHPTGFYLGLEHALSLLTSIKEEKK